MALWGKLDGANTSPISATSQVGVAANTTNRTALFGNTTANAFISGVTVGVFGADTAEQQAARDAGVAKGASPGWQLRTTKGDRVMVETLVAMSGSGGLTTDAADDTTLPDFNLSFTTQPSDDSSATGEAVTFGVAVRSVPAGATKTYQWQLSTDSGSNWSNISDAGVYSDATTATLSISDNTGLDGNQYRCVAGATGATSITSNAATLTEAA